ncbi:MAG TPA: uracil-DNA glycosylase [Phycisphaerae bacterium]|nr:uracil-DNA glycosylase [Phycisphaerae bacterium]HNU45564.1 uracil-DNA glycosylase [Phycisphaerae bacterium]
MNIEAVGNALAQQLETDRLLGLRCVPLPAPMSLHALSGVPTSPPQPAPSGVPAAGSRPPPVRNADPEKETHLKVLNDTQVRGCTKCGLHQTRTQTVFGQGSANARLVFVGEAPGADEDRQGLAFVGKAGQLLTKMIDAMNLTREEVYICNVLKCRPPDNREPLAEEILACGPYLHEQLATIQPELIIALGAPAAKTLLQTTTSIGKLRGRFHEYFVSGILGQGPSIPVLPTYHPAYLLRNPGEKGKAWEDLQKAMARLGLSPRVRPSRR